MCPEWASEMRDRTRCEFVNVPEPHRPVNGATFGEPNGRDLSRGPPLIHSQAGGRTDRMTRRRALIWDGAMQRLSRALTSGDFLL